jgi:hypothetical protein
VRSSTFQSLCSTVYMRFARRWCRYISLASSRRFSSIGHISSHSRSLGGMDAEQFRKAAYAAIDESMKIYRDEQECEADLHQ